MKTVGIVAEYNPFHNGHRYHIEEARRVACADRVVVIMSGSFVQRGEPACADKFKRAEWAIAGGADAVIELPDVFSLSCAERFASGAVRILSGTGIVDCICFGSETGDIEALKRLSETERDSELFSAVIAEGVSYPRAMEASSGVSLSPNDILGVEYLRAVSKFAPRIEPYAIKRIGGGYGDTEPDAEFSSAMAIRNIFLRYDTMSGMSPSDFDTLSSSLPENVLKDISEAIGNGVFPASDRELSDAILYRIRTMTKDEIASLPEVSEGLENLFDKYGAADDYHAMLSGIKSKRYTMARLKRISMCALLGIDSDLQNSAAENDEALYARVLAVKKGSEDLLADICEKATVPVIVRASDREYLPPLAARVERISSLAHSVRALGQPYDKSYTEDSSYRLIVR